MKNENRTDSGFSSNIRFSDKVENSLESMRTDILDDIHRRMDLEDSRKRSLWKRIAVAASVAILLAVSVPIVLTALSHDKALSLLCYATAAGTTKEITLPDGTLVVLNGCTSLSYDSETFGKENRNVLLNGEAFFDVTKNEEVPFVVDGGNARVTVLGTKFNVEAYATDDATIVTLESGRVCMSVRNQAFECILTPGEQAIFNSKNNSLTTYSVNVEDAMAWKRGDIVFSDATMEEIARKLERSVGVHISVESKELAASRYTGEFRSGDSIGQILSFFAATDSRIGYCEEEGRIRIFKHR